jgi:hypothetical protein
MEWRCRPIRIGALRFPGIDFALSLFLGEKDLRVEFSEAYLIDVEEIPP